MKKLFLSVLFGVILVASCQSQYQYSHNVLSQSSDQDLTILLQKSSTLKTIGLVTVLIGTGVSGLGLVFLTNEYGHLNMFSLIPIGTGGIIDLVGIPILITGSLRTKRVNSYINGPNIASKFSVSPLAINYNSYTQFCPGIKFTITFYVNYIS